MLEKKKFKKNVATMLEGGGARPLETTFFSKLGNNTKNRALLSILFKI